MRRGATLASSTMCSRGMARGGSQFGEPPSRPAAVSDLAQGDDRAEGPDVRIVVEHLAREPLIGLHAAHPEQEDEVGMLEVVEPERDVWRPMRC